MPARKPQFKDRGFEIHILVVEKRGLERIPDGHAQIKFEWNGGTRTWKIEGLLEPQSPFEDPKHNWQYHETTLPQGQGEAILRFIEWVQSLTSTVE